jgi:hypothetical protein
MRRRPNLRSQGGQMITEAILILVLLMFMTFMIANHFKNEELVKTMVSGPWQSLAGMLQNGSWGSPDKTNAIHPNGHFRHIVIQGEPAR